MSPKNDEGFVLLDAIISVTILALVAVAMIAMARQATFQTTSSYAYTTVVSRSEMLLREASLLAASTGNVPQHFLDAHPEVKISVSSYSDRNRLGESRLRLLEIALVPVTLDHSANSPTSLRKLVLAPVEGPTK